MKKRFAVAAAVASMGSLTLTDDLKAGAVFSSDLLPPFASQSAAGAEGGDGAFRGGADAPWAMGGTILTVSHKHGKEGGEGRYGKYKRWEGGEGGEGGEGSYHYGAPPIYGSLAPIHLGCGSRELAAALAGAAGGGLIGSQIGKGDGKLAAVAAGTFLGLFLGREIGAALDASDYACAEVAANRAGSAPLGTPIVWNNPESGHSGTITPVREGTASGATQYCREYQTSAVIGGKTQQTYGTACRQPDGAWKIVK